MRWLLETYPFTGLPECRNRQNRAAWIHVYGEFSLTYLSREDPDDRDQAGCRSPYICIRCNVRW